MANGRDIPTIRDSHGTTATHAALSLSLLGGFRLRAGDADAEVPLSAQRVVAFLALHPGRRARVYVAGHLWTEVSEQRALAALRTALWRLGEAGESLVRCDAQWVGLDPEVEVDVDRCERLARDALSDGQERPSSGMVEDLRGAGDLLPDWYDDWVLFTRERLRHQRLHALERLSSRFSGAGRHADAIEAGLVAVADDPLRESAHRALIAAHLAEGNICEALRQYKICRRLLLRDLGVEPSPALEQLMAHVRRPDRAPRVTVA